jgi:hypothetical protein
MAKFTKNLIKIIEISKVSFLNVIFLKLSMGVFHDLKNVKIAEKVLKIGQLLPILANFSHIL